MKNNLDCKRKNLLDLLARCAYKEGDFVLSSGQRSPFYLNSKEVTLRAEGALILGELIFNLLPSKTDAVAGLTLGADPMVTAVSVVSALNHSPVEALIVRKEAKGHGTKAYIEGPNLKAGAKVVVLEDVVTTGKSALLAVARLRDAGYQVTEIIALVDRQAGGAESYFSEGLNFQSLFTLTEIQNHFHQEKRK
jgi:orotate phosphoribosyltransferase